MYSGKAAAQIAQGLLGGLAARPVVRRGRVVLAGQVASEMVARKVAETSANAVDRETFGLPPFDVVRDWMGRPVRLVPV